MEVEDDAEKSNKFQNIMNCFITKSYSLLIYLHLDLFQ